MLLSLSIRDLVLIESISLSLKGNFSVLTGETGAGKSILLDALSLALGMRGDVSLIRQGAEQAVVSAEFFIPLDHSVQHILEEYGLESPTTTLVIRRILSTNSTRSRAFINDQMISVGLLRRIGDQLLEIHGQFDRLLDASTHRLLLDDFAQVTPLKAAASEAFHQWQTLLQEWQSAEANLSQIQQDETFLRHQLEELRHLDIKPDEEETLSQERSSLSNYHKISEGIESALNNITMPIPVSTALHQAQKSLQRVQEYAAEKVDPAIQALERANVELSEAMQALQESQRNLNFNPQRFNEIEERLFTLRAAARKYRTTVSELSEKYQTLQTQLDSLERMNEIKEELHKKAEEGRNVFVKQATELRQKRLQAAQSLDQIVAVELPTLRLPQAQFQTDLEELPESRWTEEGMDRVEFMIAANKGQELAGLTKAASGGELARIMLALKVALSAKAALPTIIFDEIDTGVGGAVAASIGERLELLSKHVQVMAITHSPQVAACAQHHYLVTKVDQGEQMQTVVRLLDPAQRREELARMLSGAEITTEARAAADRLLVNYG